MGDELGVDFGSEVCLDGGTVGLLVTAGGEDALFGGHGRKTPGF